jgi:hypothetical protein
LTRRGQVERIVRSMRAPEFHYIQPRLEPWPSDVPLSRRAALIGAALLDLLWIDVCGRLGFRRLYKAVAKVRLRNSGYRENALRLVRFAVRDACVLYYKNVQCLQRSAVVTRMLRRRGLPAQLVIGFQPQPAEFHAWVELDGSVVWDYRSQLPFFRVLDRI